MAGDDNRRDASADGLTRRLRLVVAFVLLILIVVLVMIDNIGRLLIDPGFHSSDFIFGTLIGALLLLLGVETLNRLPKIGNGK